MAPSTSPRSLNKVMANWQDNEANFKNIAESRARIEATCNNLVQHPAKEGSRTKTGQNFLKVVLTNRSEHLECCI
jgi:hypothetical protein